MTIGTESELGSLVEAARAGRVNRRDFLARAGKLGFSAALAGSLYAALETGASAGGGHVRVIDARFQEDGKTLVVSIAQATVQLDPAIAGSNGYGDIIPINENIYEGLTRYKIGGSEIEPALAESWQTSDDGLTYVFKIRPDVTFHDGSPLDAKAVETSLLRQFDTAHPLYNEGMVYREIVFAEVASIAATSTWS